MDDFFSSGLYFITGVEIGEVPFWIFCGLGRAWCGGKCMGMFGVCSWDLGNIKGDIYVSGIFFGHFFFRVIDNAERQL